jgi:diguanylate cyclase (GGDEF)-like protein
MAIKLPWRFGVLILGHTVSIVALRICGQALFMALTINFTIIRPDPCGFLVMRGHQLVEQDRLALMLRDFASTMLTDFPIQAILDHLVERIVEALPVTAVGITLISPGKAPLYVAASDEAALRFEKLQTELEQGPCQLAYSSGEAVSSADLRAEHRFPKFVEAALPAGLAAAFTFPLRHGDGRLGALDLYRDSPGILSEEDMEAAQTLADVAAAYILNAQARDDAQATSDRFQDSALHDALTGLPNRLLLHQRLAHAARRAERSHSYAAVLFADLDRFKQINDTYGHQVGDDLLVAVGRRLSRLVRPGDTLARVSGDEFVFLCEDLVRPEDVESLATRINDALAIPFELSNVVLSATASVGMAYAGPGEAVTNQLVVDADIAMYQAKRNGGAGHQIIDVRAAKKAAASSSLEQDLHAAFATEKLAIAVQPIVRPWDGEVVGVEALLRWMHAQRGPIPTTDMIGLAEANGLINQIGAWVLETSCIAHNDWRREYQATPLALSVNVSARQLMGPRLPQTVGAILEKTDTDPSTVILELTEGIFIHDSARALSVLTDLKSLGVQLALDDFGTGYSSLSYLRDFPVDILKIDQKFVADSATDAAGASLVSAITGLAHDLGLSVIAEGVESQAQADAVCELGCDLAQGYFYARPMPPLAFQALVEGSASGPLLLTGAVTDAVSGLA